MTTETLEKPHAAAYQLLALDGKGTPVSDTQLLKIERFLRAEARLLDNERYREWHGLMAEDLFYWLPLRSNRFRREKRPEIEPTNMAIFDETRDELDLRIQRLESGMTWTEDPPTRHVYAITNVEAFETDVAGEFEVHSVFTLYRNRSEHDDNMLMGRRRDILRQKGDSFEIARRLILIQQATLLTKNLTVFF